MNVAEAFHTRGIEAAQTGRFEEAAALLRQAIEIEPTHPAYHANLGLAFVYLDQYEDGARCYRTAIALRPGHADTLAKLGRVLSTLGNTDEAVACLRQAAALDTNNPDTQNALGAALAAAGSLDDAAHCFRTALQLDGSHGEAHTNLAGALLLKAERHAAAADWAAAEPIYREALAHAPLHAGGRYNLGVCLTAQGKTDEAIRCYEIALLIEPSNAQAWNNMALLSHSRGESERAIAFYRRAIEHDPGYLEARYNVAVTLTSLERYDHARAAYTELLTQDPTHADTHNNLGGIALAEGRLEEAETYYAAALAHAPEHPEAGWNLGLVRLTRGDFPRGWEGYELRLKQKNFPARHFNAPRWQGEDVRGKTVLVWAEQGLGDTLQFVRYLAAVAEAGARVVLECQPRLEPLLACLPGIDALSLRGEPLPPHDYHIPLLSLPGLFHTQTESIPSPATGWNLPAERIEKWRTELAAYPARKVGLCWAGHPHNTAGRKRSAPLAALAPLAQVDGVTLFSLQRGPQASELASETGIVKLERDDNDILDTAAIVSNLDLVISVDTMLAHLAGTLSQPVWTLLPFAADWRWMSGRDDSPWYPTMRLFRQRRTGDWRELAERVAQALPRA